MTFNKPITDIIKQRKSVRSYENIPLEQGILDKINDLLAHINTGIFGNKCSFKLIENEIAKEKKIKLGTYGFISGARYYISGAIQKAPFCFEDYGYLLEKIILHCTDMGLGTCWLGGTFSRSTFSKMTLTSENTIIPSVTPVGYGAKKSSIKDRLIRFGAKSDNRKAWQELFFNDNFSNPLEPEEAGYYKTPLEMIRLAPSASNKQPWRIMKSEKSFHFFLKRTPGYKGLYKDIDLQKIDMGIAMAHFELTCTEMSLNGKWQSAPPLLSEIDMEYIISWVEE